MDNSTASNLEKHIEKPRGQRVGLDALDRLPLAALPQELLGDALPHAIDAVNAMAEEGPYGPAIRRLLSREIQIGRAELRFAEAVRNVEATRFLQGADNVRRLDVAERLVVDQHRRMLSAIEAYARISSGLSPRIQVSAHQAVVAVGGVA